MDKRAESAHPVDALSRARALYSESLSPENTLVIREILRNALQNPAGFDRRRLAETWAFLADVSTCDYLNRWNDAGPDQLAQAEEAVRRALDIVPDLPSAHYVTGFIRRAMGSHDAALAAFGKTIELDSGFTRAYAQKANELVNVGRPEEAPSLLRQAIALTAPGSLSLGMFYWIAGRAHFFMDRPQTAVEWFAKSVEIRPNLWYNRLYMASSYALNQESAMAAAALREFDGRFPNYTMARVVRNEQANPNDHPVIVAGRERFHQGLRSAGMLE
jgi:tetratricopeptide (TPR) repeat protein